MITPKKGIYYYAPYGKGYRIYQYTHVNENGSESEATNEIYWAREQARARVYELNGWNKTK